MQSNESPAQLELSTDWGVKTSPFRPINLFNLFFRPRRFSDQLHADDPYVHIFMWLSGISIANTFIGPFKTDAENHLLVTEMWLLYLIIYLVGGAVFGLLQWVIGVWFYKVRIHWAGDPDPDPDGFLAYQVYFYSSGVAAIPMLSLTLIYVVKHLYFGDSPNFFILFFLAALIFHCWSTIVGYIGVRRSFNTKVWGSVFWFLVIPLLPLLPILFLPLIL